MNRLRRLLPCLLVLLAACGRDPGGGNGGANASSAPKGPPIHFVDVSNGSGLVRKNVSGDPLEKMAIVENIGQGAAVLEYDNDGLLDIYQANGDVFPGTTTVTNPDPRPALYHNEGGLRFRDVTEEAGLVFSGWAHGAWAVDFDGDGFTDLYVTVYRGPNRFFRNKGDGTFEDMTARWGGADTGPSTAAAFFDADQDGDLDLYVGNYVAYDPEDPPNNGEPCDWKGLKVSCGPRGTPPAADTFYENVGDRLVEATERFGFGGVPKVYALGAVTGDFDGDGDVDLYVANDSEENFFFENQGDGRFRECALDYGLDMGGAGTAQAGMGVDAGDLDNDLRLDIFVTNFSQDYNTTYINQQTASGKTWFSDETENLDLNLASFEMLSWGCRITDLDRDGWQDLIVVSGHVYPQVDGTALGTTYAQQNQVFLNLGTGDGRPLRFKEITSEAGPGFQKRSVTRGLVTADLDNDGDLDLFMVEMDALPTLLRNDGSPSGHWIGFELIGKGRNREAIGARLIVTDSMGVRRLRERHFGSSYFSTCDKRQLFGLGPAGDAVRRVEVRWPDGTTQAFEDLAPDRYWVLRQGEAQARDPRYPRPAPNRESSAAGAEKDG